MTMANKIITGNIVDIPGQKIFAGTIEVENKK